jgi:hypothetical protein
LPAFAFLRRRRGQARLRRLITPHCQPPPAFDFAD